MRKQNLLKRVRRQRLKYITILPSLITLLNGVLGFAAIAFTSKGPEQFTFNHLPLTGFAVAGYMILFAMIADMLDGRVARMSKTTSSFGGQLDSLCDIISFGVAPAFLVLKVLEQHFNEIVSSNVVFLNFLERFIWLAAAVYLVCSAIRLARFNVENEEDETAHMCFVGLPTPAGAGVLVSLVIFKEVVLPGFIETSTLFKIVDFTVLYSLPFIAIGVAILMISRIRYPHVVNQYLKGRKPFTHLVSLGGVIGLIWLFGLENAILISFCGFALSGFSKWLYHRALKVIKKHEHAQDSALVTASSTEKKDGQNMD